MYICEASLEYVISVLVAGSFLATLTKELGISDNMTGIISSIVSLGFVFQLFSIFIYRRRVKKLVVTMSIINQLLFMLLYVIPISNINQHVKTAVFTSTIFLAYLLYNIAHPKKINWFMSLVNDGNRGRFTANKEIISLVAGMAFTYIMGALMDYFKDKGDIRTSFIICAITIFLLMVLHTITMLLSVENTDDNAYQKTNPYKSMAAVIRDKKVLQIAMIFIIWSIASFSTIPFYGTYQINELGFSLKYVSFLAIVYSVVRVSVSRLWGLYADRKSFAAMIKLCFFVMAIGFLLNVFAAPANGKIFFTLYNICHGIAMGGINSALINLVFDYVPSQKRADTLALSQALSGTAGFLSTLCLSSLVSYIQKNGNQLFGMKVYAQQITSLIALLFTVAAMLYTGLVISRSKDQKEMWQDDT